VQEICGGFPVNVVSTTLWSFWVGYLSLGDIGTAQCWIGPVALSSCTVQIHVKISAANAVLRTDSIVLSFKLVPFTKSQKNPVDTPLAAFQR
jgi:hypothetical protein